MKEFMIDGKRVVRGHDLGMVVQKPEYREDIDGVTWMEFPAVSPNTYPAAAVERKDYRAIVPVGTRALLNSGVDPSKFNSDTGEDVFAWAHVTINPDTLDDVQPTHFEPSEIDPELAVAWDAGDDTPIPPRTWE
jgi:hypothetical protein